MKRCSECNITLRSSRERPSPGTRRHAGRGLCANCYARLVRSDDFEPMQRGGLRPCAHCGRTMRPVKATLDQYPGTVSRTNATSCASCYRKHGKPAEAKAGAVPSHLAAYFARRQHRIQHPKRYLQKVSPE